MKTLQLISILLMLAPPAAARADQRQGSGSSTSPLSLSPGAGSVIAIQINGRPARLRVDPGMGLSLNPGAATRLGLSGGIFGGTISIGPHRLAGKSSLVRLQIGTWAESRRIFWFERDLVEGVDGTIGMADLPNETVTLQLRQPEAGEQRHSFRVSQERVAGLMYRQKLGDREVLVQFTPHRPSTQASAAVGALLGQLHGGTWSGAPREQLILAGISRPVRPMRLSRPVSLNGFQVQDLLIRTDYRGSYSLPTDPPAAEQEGDPSEIVVTGSREGGKALFRVTVGADQLSRCSSISYSKRASVLTLSCRSDQLLR